MLGGLTFLYMHERKRFIDCAFHSLCVIVSGSPGLENPSLAACLVLKVLVETIPSARCSKLLTARRLCTYGFTMLQQFRSTI